MDTIRKTLTCEVKELEDRTLEFVGSTETEDRMGDVVRSVGWELENYMKNPIFLWCHDYHSPPIGKCVKCWPEDGKLMFKIQFAPKETYEFADTCYKLYKGGFLNAVSVGFAPDEEEMRMYDGGGCEFNRQELLELSAVPVPANADALISARSNKLITVKEFNQLNKIIKPKEISQEEIKDELDYAKELIAKGDLNKDNENLLADIYFLILNHFKCTASCSYDSNAKQKGMYVNYEYPEDKKLPDGFLSSRILADDTAIDDMDDLDEQIELISQAIDKAYTKVFSGGN